MDNRHTLEYWLELCESYEAGNGVIGAQQHMELPFACDQWDALGEYYSKIIAKEHRSKHGQFFTPKVIVHYLINSTHYSSDQTVADISCGSGRFLLGILEKMVQEQRSLKQIQRSVYGYDIDPILIRITLANIRGFLASNGYKITNEDEFHIEQADMLGKIGGLFESSIRFDCILGNPPYLKANPKQNLGHPNLYASFVEAAVRMLRPGGSLGYIIPKSFVSGAYFHRMRDILANQVNTHELVTIFERDKAFNGVLQEQVLLTLKNTLPNNDRIVVGTAITNGKFEVNKFEAERDIVFWNSDIVCIPETELDALLVKKCFKNGFKKVNASGLRVSTGPVVPFRRKQYLSNEEGKNFRPLFWPHNISAFKFDPKREHRNRFKTMHDCMDTVSEKLCQDTVVFKRISAKEQSRRIEAVLIKKQNDGCFLENHLNYIVRENENAPSLEIMEVLLNSVLWDKLFRLINGNTQVSAAEIRVFPIPHNIDCIKSMLSDKQNSERKIHEAYGLTTKESDYILQR